MFDLIEKMASKMGEKVGPNVPVYAGIEGPPGHPESWKCRKCGTSVPHRVATCPKCGNGR